MPIRSFDELFAAADAESRRVPVAAAGGADPTVLQALAAAASRGWVEPIVTGQPDEIRRMADQLELDLAPFRILEDDGTSADTAVDAVRSGEARLLMKGQIATPALMKAVLDHERGLRTDRTICQIVLMEIVRDQRQFLMADTGVTIEPSFAQKEDILRSLVDVAHLLGLESPRIAVMSASEKVSGALPDTEEAARLAQKAATGQFGECVVQGPLSFDLAYSPDAGAKKQVEGGVTGAADAMLFPNLLSANLTVKALMYTADCRFGGVLWGAACPVIFMSRADTTETRLRSIALGLHALKQDAD
ncbi:MAG: phosphate acyltransferase [Maioricimonas sp. JB049]